MRAYPFSEHKAASGLCRPMSFYVAVCCGSYGDNLRGEAVADNQLANSSIGSISMQMRINFEGNIKTKINVLILIIASTRNLKVIPRNAISESLILKVQIKNALLCVRFWKFIHPIFHDDLTTHCLYFKAFPSLEGGLSLPRAGEDLLPIYFGLLFRRCLPKKLMKYLKMFETYFILCDGFV